VNPIEQEDDPREAPDPRNLALRRLAIREYGSGEMRAYLRRKGVSSQGAAETVEALVKEKLIDDRRYARVIVRDQSFKDKGPTAILAKLRQKGVQIELREVREIFGSAADVSEAEAVKRILDRRYPNAKKDPKEARRAYMALLRRGFSSAMIRHFLSFADGADGS